MLKLLFIFIITIINCAYSLPSITIANSANSNKYMKDGILEDFETDFFFEGNPSQNTEIDDLSIGLQSLFVSFSRNMKTIVDHIDNLEQKSNALLDRLNLLDCYDLKMQDPLRPPGKYKLYLDHVGKKPVYVYCDMITDGGGWTVIQQRLPREVNSSGVNFDRFFHEYKVGFGTPESDYWIGLDNIHVWTNSRPYELWIQLEDFNNNTGHALYKSFHVENEDKGYKMHLGDYSGDIGDSLGGNNSTLDNFTANGMMFSTRDMDQDTSFEINCSKFWNIGGWWNNRCSWANLNGPYRFPGDGKGIGINWHKWRNNEYMRSTKMMIRPQSTTITSTNNIVL